MGEEAEEDKDEGPLAEAEACKADGNALLNKGDYADACKRYDDGLLALLRASADAKDKVAEVRLALHLNASLAHFRRGNLSSAVDHASGALAIDPRSAKALYRRGLARASLAEHRGNEAEAQQARRDLQAALEIEPNNAAVRDKLQALKAQAREEEKVANKAQKAAYKNIFASKEALYKEEEIAPAPAEIREQDNDLKGRLKLSAAGVYFHYDKGTPVLEDVTLRLAEGRSLGMFGNNATGKTTLARILAGKLSPTKGQVIHHNKAAVPAGATLITSVRASLVVGALVVVVAVLVQGAQMKSYHWACFAACTCLLVLVIKFFLDKRSEAAAKHKVIFLSSDSCDKEYIPPNRTIEHVVGEFLPKHLKKEARRAKVIAMLEAGGFQMYNQETGEEVGCPKDYIRDGLTYGTLSGGQQHLMYILRGFAACPAVLLCDELLGGLDAIRQPRVLHMLNTLRKEQGVAVLYITTELHQLRLCAEYIGVMSDGRLCELDKADEVLDFPKHPVTREYISSYRGLPGGQVIGGKLAQNFSAVSGDEALLSPDWLPR